MKYLVPVGRVFFSLIFIMAAPGHFTKGTIGYAAAQGVPMASVLVPLSGVIALLGGLSILLGYRAQWGAWLIILFLVPVTLSIHNFWTVADPMMRMTQKIMFEKNLAMLGSALILTHFGSGPCSIDNWLKARCGCVT